MPTIDYAIQLPYGYDDVNGRPYPRLTFRISAAANATSALDVDAYLDSGAERSLFDGRLAPALGIDLLTGREERYGPVSGPALLARLHAVRISHDILGAFELEVGFSTADINRSLLGRDFFRQTQIGFHESLTTLYFTGRP